MVIYTNFVKWITGGFAIGITIWPFILIVPKHRGNKVLLNHEKIHLEQQKELWIFGFLYLYVYHYLKNLVIGFFKGKGWNHKWAYRQIPFEKEAYDNEEDLAYLEDRDFKAYKEYV